MRHVGAGLALLLLASTLVAAAARGPSTVEERGRVVEQARLLETTPWTAEAQAARDALTAFLGEVPDITVKYCPGLLGGAAERGGISEDLLKQHSFSSAAYMMTTPQSWAGSTATLLAGLRGTLRAYQAWKAHDPAVAHPRLEELLRLEATNQIEPYVRAQGRVCR